MSRFEQIKDASGNPELQAAYKSALELGWQGVEEGIPNNFNTSLSSRPDFIQMFVDMTKTIAMQGQVPMTVKTMLFATIAARSNCEYCTVANKMGLEMLGVPQNIIDSCLKDPELSEVPAGQRSIIQFGLKAAKKPKDVTDEDFKTLRDQGLSDGEILEIVMMAGLAVILDMYADVSQVVVDGQEG